MRNIFYAFSSFIYGVRCYALALCVLLSLAASAQASASSPAFVQANAKQVTMGTTNSVKFIKANKAGDLIVVYHLYDNAGGVATKDSLGNTYKSCGVQKLWHDGMWSGEILYAENIKAGTNTVTTTYTKSINKNSDNKTYVKFGIVYIQEYSGVAPSNPCIASAAASGIGPTISSGAANASADSLVVAGLGSTSIANPDASFTVHNGLGVISLRAKSLRRLVLSRLQAPTHMRWMLTLQIWPCLELSPIFGDGLIDQAATVVG
jgi:hypothetical protein